MKLGFREISALVAMVTVMVSGAAPALADTDGVYGYAFGTEGSVVGVGSLAQAPRVALPTDGSGGSASDSLPGLSLLAGTITTGLRNVSISGTTGSTGAVDAGSTVHDVDVLGLLTINEVTTECHATESGITGSVTIVGGSLGGVPLPSSPAPGTTMQIDGLLQDISVTMNQQSSSSSSEHHQITVTGVEVVLTGTVEGTLVFGEVRCRLDYSDPEPTTTTTTTTTTTPTSTSSTSTTSTTAASTATTTTPTSPTSTTSTSTTQPPTGETTTTSTTEATGATLAPTSTTQAGSDPDLSSEEGAEVETSSDTLFDGSIVDTEAGVDPSSDDDGRDESIGASAPPKAGPPTAGSSAPADRAPIMLSAFVIAVLATSSALVRGMDGVWTRLSSLVPQ